MAADAPGRVGLGDVARWYATVLAPDRAFIRLALVYGLGISLVSLATPISVQLLINSVANTALATPLFTLAGLLFALLLGVVTLSALRIHLMALFERRMYARLVAEILLRTVHARDPFFSDARREDLFNRYFDLTGVQKAAPSLLIGGFTVLIQSAVGLAVTSFYHPFFLAFDLLLVVLVFLILAVWTGGAVRTAVGVSHAKHDTAKWLENVGMSDGYYKSERRFIYAMDRTDAVSARYVDAHKRHFRYSFAQTLSFLLLYATASAGLLALGGWLIIQGQLSIGQLVAAELILSGVFYGVAQLGTYLDSFYDLAAGLEELSLFYDIPQERPRAGGARPADGRVHLRGVVSGDARFDFALEAGEQALALAQPGAAEALMRLLDGHGRPERGLVTVGGADIASLDPYVLRGEVLIFDRPATVELTVRQHLALLGSEPSAAQMLEALDCVGLGARVADLPHGLDTELSTSGAPLAIPELMALKLAAALLARPKVLVLSQLYDLMPPARLEAALLRLRGAGTTVLRFSGRPRALGADRWWSVGLTAQARLAGHDAWVAELETREGAHAAAA